MFIEFDTEIYANESILTIPLVATVLPLAWLSGSNIYVDALDIDFKQSMDGLQKVFMEYFPLPPFKTEINAHKLIENQIKPEDTERSTGLLFSGGIDSTYSMITNMNHKPRLIMHWGVEGPPYPIYREYWEMVSQTYNRYAKENDLAFNLIKTNALEILDRKKIEHRFHKELYYGSLWVRLQHSLVMLCLAAPLSINRFDKFLIAASNYMDSPETIISTRPHSQRPETDEKIGWAGLKVKHDGYIPRYQKVPVISEYQKSNDVILRVCLARPGDQTTPEKMNCNNCRKCYRTIMQLVQADSDPENYGFEVTDITFEKIKEHYLDRGHLDVYGKNAKKILPDIIEYDYRGSRKFFEWLREFESSNGEENTWHYRDIYDFLPYPLAKVLNEIYRMLGIKIHRGNPHLPQDKVYQLEEIKRKYGRMTGL
jgi:hypothetical protein